MNDYHVVYVEAAEGEERALIAVRIERQCNVNAAEGWLLYETILDVKAGTTVGVWLVFDAAEEDDDVRVEGAIAEAEQIIDEGGL